MAIKTVIDYKATLGSTCLLGVRKVAVYEYTADGKSIKTDKEDTAVKVLSMNGLGELEIRLEGTGAFDMLEKVQPLQELAFDNIDLNERAVTTEGSAFAEKRQTWTADSVSILNKKLALQKADAPQGTAHVQQ